MPGTSLPSSTATFGKNTLNFMSHCNWLDVCWYLIRYPPKVLLREISVNAMVVVFVKGKKDALYLSSSTLGSNFLHCYIMTHLPCNPQVDIVHRTNHYLSSIINSCHCYYMHSWSKEAVYSIANKIMLFGQSYYKAIC